MARSRNGNTAVYNLNPLTLSDEEGVAIAVDVKGGVLLSPLPAGATMLSNSSGNVANATATATLTSAVGRTVWITGFSLTGAGATAGAVVTVTVIGTLGGTISYTYTASTGATVSNTPLFEDFTLPVPASATNTNIVISCPALGIGNTNNSISARGFII